MPRVSILIPAYNRANYLSETLASALAQTLDDIEIIVVDDGSTDETARVVHAISDVRVRYTYQENRGVSAALNTAWRAASSEFVAILGSDDVMLPEQIATLLPPLEEDARVGVVYARAIGMDAQGAPLTQLSGAPERFAGQTLLSLVYGDFVCPIAVLIRRAALAECGGYDESLIGNEDWDLWIRLARTYKFVYVPRVLARYRYHSQNLTRTKSARMERLMQDRVRVLDKFFAQPDVPAEILTIKPIAYRNVYMDWMIRYLERGDFKNAYAKFQTARALSPAPLRFLPRAAAVVAYYFVLSKTHWGVRLVEALTARRRQRASS